MIIPAFVVLILWGFFGIVKWVWTGSFWDTYNHDPYDVFFDVMFWPSSRLADKWEYMQ